MAMLLTLLEQHLDREPLTVVIQAIPWWEAVLALVYLQEGGLGVHLHVHVRCDYTPGLYITFFFIWGGSH